MSPLRTLRAVAAATAIALIALAPHAPALAQQSAGDPTDGSAAGADDATAGATAGATDAAPPRAGASEDGGAAPSDPSSGVQRVPEGVAEARPGSGSSYPTVALADYVLGCMSANGNTYLALQQCSCSIDYIRERMDWQDYERANTVMQVQLDRGQRGIFYRDSNWAKTRVGRLQELQAESSLRCF